MRGALATLRDRGPSSKGSVYTGRLLHRPRPPSFLIGFRCKPHTRAHTLFFFTRSHAPLRLSVAGSLAYPPSSGLPLDPSCWIADSLPSEPKALSSRHAVRPFTLAQHGRSRIPCPVSPSVIPPHRSSAKAEASPLSPRPASTVSLTLVGPPLFLQAWGFSASSGGEWTLYERSPFQPAFCHIAASWKTISPSVKGKYLWSPTLCFSPRQTLPFLHWLPSQVNWDCPLILPRRSYSVESFCCRNQYWRNQEPYSESWRTQVYYASGTRGVNTPNSEPRAKGLQSFYTQTGMIKQICWGWAIAKSRTRVK